MKLNKKGNLSIIFVIAIFTFMLVAFFFLNVTYLNMSRNEVQGILDNSGVIALRYAVDETAWREEELIVDKGIAKAKFRQLVNDQIKTGDDTLLKDFEIRELRVYSPNEVGNLGLSTSKKQYFLEVVADVKYNASATVVDVSTNSTNYFYNFFSKQDESRMISGEKGDKEGELVIRSVSRLILR